MRLKTYLEIHNMTYREFAKRIKISHTTIYHIVKGRPCSKEVASLIEKATGGEVEILNLLYPER